MRAALFAGLMCAMLAAMPVAGLASSNPVRLVATGFVAVTTGTGTMQIFSFALDGSHEKQLTTGPADRHYPSLSPDGRQLLYTGEDGGHAEVYLLDLSHPMATAIAVTRPPVTANSASWSPDGAAIVYSGLLPGQQGYQIFRSNPDGGGVIQLTRTPGSGNASPAFSPDGSRVAFINGAPGTLTNSSGEKVTGLVDRIWVMGADGSGARPLTAGPRDAYPAWLDDSTVMFARSLGSSLGTQILIAGLDGTERAISPVGQSLVEPKPLPDGRGYGATQSTRSGLRVVTVDRSDHAALASATAPPSFVIKPIDVPPHDGSVFTLNWVVGEAPSAAASTGLPVWVAALLLGFVAIAVAGLLIRRRRRRA
jgi:Tol biopolymer transport system component